MLLKTSKLKIGRNPKYAENPKLKNENFYPFWKYVFKLFDPFDHQVLKEFKIVNCLFAAYSPPDQTAACAGGRWEAPVASISDESQRAPARFTMLIPTLAQFSE